MNECPASESNNLLEQISELSRQFRKQIAKGEKPKIERVLHNPPDSTRNCGKRLKQHRRNGLRQVK